MIEKLDVLDKYTKIDIERTLKIEGPDGVDWIWLITHTQLPDSFLTKYSNYLHWDLLSSYNRFSEKRIEKFKDKLDWSVISYTQIMSEKFMIKHKSEIDWDHAIVFQVMTKKFLNKICHKSNIPRPDYIYLYDNGTNPKCNAAYLKLLSLGEKITWNNVLRICMPYDRYIACSLYLEWKEMRHI